MIGTKLSQALQSVPAEHDNFLILLKRGMNQASAGHFLEAYFLISALVETELFLIIDSYERGLTTQLTGLSFKINRELLAYERNPRNKPEMRTTLRWLRIYCQDIELLARIDKAVDMRNDISHELARKNLAQLEKEIALYIDEAVNLVRDLVKHRGQLIDLRRKEISRTGKRVSAMEKTCKQKQEREQ